MALLKLLCISITFVISVVIFWPITITTAQIQPANSRSRYGEFCNTTSKCYKGAWLTCRDGVCDCARSEEMKYDNQKQKCVSKAGERCRFELSSDSGLNEQTECVENAKCGTDGICMCEKLFYETLNGNCLSQGNNGETCVSDESCRGDKFLECIEGVCSCNQTLSEYSTSKGHCVGLAGQPCLKSTCTPNSVCSLLQPAICICSPDDDYYRNSNGRCEAKKGFGVSCESNKECKTKDIFLACVEGNCTCNPKISKYELTNYIIKESYEETVQTNERDYSYGYNNHYSNIRYKTRIETKTRDIVKERHECVGLADSPCNPNQKCVKNSICSNSNRLFHFQCDCNNGYSKTSKGICGFDFGSPCDNNSVCSDDFICSKGKCACKDYFHQVHSPKTLTSPSKCLGIVSARCTDHTDCIPNTLCNFNEVGGTGRCECDNTGHPKFVENGDGHCELAHGSPCDYKSTTTPKTCDKLAQLECRNELCSCPEESMTFNAEHRQCFQLVGARCSETSPCVPSAFCVRKRLGLSGVCECPDGFQENLDGKCDEVIISESAEVHVEIQEINNGTTPSYETETGPVLGLVANWTDNMIES